MKLSRAAGWTVLAVLLLALILVPFLLGESAVFDASRRLLSEPGSRAWLGAMIVGLLAADLFLPIPSSFVAAGAVAALGGIFGGTVVWLGLTAAALLGYAVGRYGGAALALRVVGAAELARAERLHQRFGALVLIVCRGVPVLAEASTVFAGALRMRLAHFMLVTSSANAGLALAYATLASLGTGIFALLAPFVLGIVLPALALLVVARLERARATRSGKPEHP